MIRTVFPIRNCLIWSSLLIGVMILFSLFAWSKIPASQLIATHWGMDGQADGYSNKTTAFLLLPAVSIFLVALFIFITQIEPRRQNIRQSSKAYSVIFIIVIAFMAVMHGVIIASAFGKAVDMLLILPLMLGALMLLLGYNLGNIRSNYMVGIRTPWTLSSDLAWDKTHHLGGKFFFLLGILLLLTMPYHNGALLFLLLISQLLLLTVMLAIYSYLVWRTDPNKKNNQQPAISVIIAEKPNSLRPIIITTLVLQIGCAVILFASAIWLLPAADIQSRTIQLIQAQDKGDFAQAEQYFTPVMRKAIPANKLSDFWDDLSTQHGRYQKIIKTTTVNGIPYTMVYAIVRFEKAKLTIRVVFNRNGQISGLWLAKVTSVE